MANNEFTEQKLLYKLIYEGTNRPVRKITGVIEINKNKNIYNLMVPRINNNRQPIQGDQHTQVYTRKQLEEALRTPARRILERGNPNNKRGEAIQGPDPVGLDKRNNAASRTPKQPKPPNETPKPPNEIPKPPNETPKPPKQPKPPNETPKPPNETPKPSNANLTFQEFKTLDCVKQEKHLIGLKKKLKERKNSIMGFLLKEKTGTLPQNYVNIDRNYKQKLKFYEQKCLNNNNNNNNNKVYNKIKNEQLRLDSQNKPKLKLLNILGIQP